MSRFPSLRARELVAALEKAGFERRRQSGSHLILKNPDGRRAVVPMHPGDMKRGTAAAILDAAGLTEDQLRDLL